MGEKWTGDMSINEGGRDSVRAVIFGFSLGTRTIFMHLPWLRLDSAFRISHSRGLI